MSSADACVTAYTRGLELSKPSLLMPVTLTGDRMVFITSRDQKLANLCWMRPLRSKSEQISETVPRMMVYAQMSGARIKYERRRLSQPWRLTRCTPAFPSDQVGTAAPGCPPERSSACSFSSSAVVAILFKVAYTQTFSPAGGPAPHIPRVPRTY